MDRQAKIDRILCEKEKPKIIQTCQGCLSEFHINENSDTLLPSHPYIGSTSFCWKIYSDILGREFENQAYFKVHRVTVDSYAAQHIGDQNDRRARQSANIHLISLYLMFEKKYTANEVLKFLECATKIKRDWPSILQRAHAKWLTVQDIIQARTETQHINIVLDWGRSVWESYKDIHSEIIFIYGQFIKQN